MTPTAARALAAQLLAAADRADLNGEPTIDLGASLQATDDAARADLAAAIAAAGG